MVLSPGELRGIALGNLLPSCSKEGTWIWSRDRREGPLPSQQ